MSGRMPHGRVPQQQRPRGQRQQQGVSYPVHMPASQASQVCISLFVFISSEFLVKCTLFFSVQDASQPLSQGPLTQGGMSAMSQPLASQPLSQPDLSQVGLFCFKTMYIAVAFSILTLWYACCYFRIVILVMTLTSSPRQMLFFLKTPHTKEIEEDIWTLNQIMPLNQTMPPSIESATWKAARRWLTTIRVTITMTTSRLCHGNKNAAVFPSACLHNNSWKMTMMWYSWHLCHTWPLNGMLSYQTDRLTTRITAMKQSLSVTRLEHVSLKLRWALVWTELNLCTFVLKNTWSS